MRRVARKLLFGRGRTPSSVPHSTLVKHWENLTHIWNNTYEEDAGLEKIVRLVLAFSQFLFPGLYLKHAFWKKGSLYQDLVTDGYVLLKAAFPIVLLWQGWWRHDLLIGSNLWLTTETLLYIPTMIFASDALPRPALIGVRNCSSSSTTLRWSSPSQ